MRNSGLRIQDARGRWVRPGKLAAKRERAVHLTVKAHVADWLVTAAREQACVVSDVIDNLLTDAGRQCSR